MSTAGPPQGAQHRSAQRVGPPVSTGQTSAAVAGAPIRRQLDRDDLLMRAGIGLLILWLMVTLVLPL